MVRILFVDDEDRVLAGLRRMLHRKRDEWQAVYALGGREALAVLDREPFDIVVTDMRMPEVSGTDVLAHVQRRYPGAVRMILSGHVAREGSSQMVGLAHQFLAKPCDRNELFGALDRACAMRTLLQNPVLRRVAGEVTALPSAPDLYAKLVAKIRADASIPEIAAVVEQDVGTSAKVLKVVNSAFFGLPQRTARIVDAVAYLGLNMLRSLTLSSSVYKAFRYDGSIPGFSPEAEQTHGLAVGQLAREIAGPEESDAAFIGGLMHDVGKLVVASRAAALYAEVLAVAEREGRSAHDVETEHWGISHAAIGGYLLGLWGLPNAVVEAVAYHHRPADAPQATRAVMAVHVANTLIREQGGRSPTAAAPLDHAFLAEAGVEESDVATWRARAEAIHRAGGTIAA